MKRSLQSLCSWDGRPSYELILDGRPWPCEDVPEGGPKIPDFEELSKDPVALREFIQSLAVRRVRKVRVNPRGLKIVINATTRRSQRSY